MNNWEKFTKSEQLAAIGAEVVRASIWEEKDKSKFMGALERALALIDASIDDPQWKGELYTPLYLRDEVGKYYAGEQRGIATLRAAM